MKITDVATGSEGPAHDPYSYHEVTTLLGNGLEMVTHVGLVGWVEVARIRIEGLITGDDAANYFRQVTHISVGTALELYEEELYHSDYEESPSMYGGA